MRSRCGRHPPARWNTPRSAPSCTCWARPLNPGLTREPERSVQGHDQQSSDVARVVAPGEMTDRHDDQSLRQHTGWRANSTSPVSSSVARSREGGATWETDPACSFVVGLPKRFGSDRFPGGSTMASKMAAVATLATAFMLAACSGGNNPSGAPSSVSYTHLTLPTNRE